MPVLGHRTGEKDCRLVKTLVLGIKEVQRLVLFSRPPHSWAFTLPLPQDLAPKLMGFSWWMRLIMTWSKGSLGMRGSLFPASPGLSVQQFWIQSANCKTAQLRLGLEPTC